MDGEQKATPVNPFGYFKPHEDALPVIQEVRVAYKALYDHIMTLPPSRERSVAITELETSAMWAIKGLVLNDPQSTQPEESGVTGMVNDTEDESDAEETAAEANTTK